MMLIFTATTLIGCTPKSKDASTTDEETPKETTLTVASSNSLSLLSVYPVQGPEAGAQSLTLTGSNFLSGATVSIGNTLCSAVQFIDSNSVACTSPALNPGNYDVTITNPNAAQSTLTASYTVIAAPQVTSITPQSGALAGGDTLTLTGTGFSAGATITVGGTSCTSITIQSATQATCTLPSHSSGSVDVTFSNSDNQAATLSSAYTYNPLPTINSVVASSGPTVGGQIITLTGTGFIAGATVQIGGTACTSVNVVSSTSVTCTTPAKSAGTYSIEITNFDAQSATLSNAYTSIAAPTISTVSPIAGPLAGGTSITLTGTGFFSGATVTIGGTPCTSVNVVSATSITCNTPAKSANNYSIIVTNSDSQATTLSNSFTYRAAPTLSSVTASSGTVAGGQSITLTGTGFVAAATVLVGGANCTSVNVISATSITCTTPNASAGTVNLQVTNPEGQSGQLASAYTYFDPLSISPSTLTLVSGELQTFTASGGIAPYSYSIVSGSGDVDSATGEYTAAAPGTDVVRVTDNVGNMINATVTVNMGLAISPENPILMVNAQTTFSATGGIAPYSFTITAGGGSVGTTSGIYTAPGTADTVTIELEDSASHTVSTNITVAAGLAITPFTRTMGTSQNIQFASAGGVAPITYSIVSGNGSIDSNTGFYSASSDPGSVVVRATDSIANTADSTLTIVKPVKIKAAIGGTYACALFNNGSMKCWGNNSYGQLLQGHKNNLGDGASEVANMPFINFGNGRTVVDFDTGYLHACAILDNGTAKCWGRNNYGQLGKGNTTTYGDAAAEIGDLLTAVNVGVGRTVAKVATGVYHTCFLLDNHDLKCVGYNAYGQLGYENTTNLGNGAATVPANIAAVNLGTDGSGNSVYATHVVGGGHSTCAILNDGRTKCWGYNNTGQLGLGLATSVRLGDAATEMGDNLAALNFGTDSGTPLTALSIQAGRYSYCAILSNSRVKCWGQGSSGQLGIGSTSNIGDGATEVGNNVAYANFGSTTTASSLGLGYLHSCVILTDNVLKCFGAGASGRLGSGGIANLGDVAGEVGNNLLAVDLGLNRYATMVTGGTDFTCAILDNNTIKCFGANASGQLGIGSTSAYGDTSGEMGDALPALEF